jgi:hypothetical protein
LGAGLAAQLLGENKMSKKLLGLLVIVLLLVGATAVLADSPTYTENWDGRGTDSLDCTGYDVGESGIHWVFSTKGASTDAVLTLGGTGSGTYHPAAPLNAEVWHFDTPYFELEGLTATIQLFGGDRGRGGGLVISDYCPGGFEDLAVSKTADTAYTRTHDWKISKVVKPSPLYLYTDGTYKGFGPGGNLIEGEGPANVIWGVTVGYRGFVDSGFNVSGQIDIENTGTLDAVITSVDDVLAGTSIGVACGVTFPYTLPVGGTLACFYSEDGFVEGFNEVTVTTERDSYFANAEIVWDNPDPDLYAQITIVDDSDLFGAVTLGTLNAYALAHNPTTFTYSRLFAWEHYGQEDCGDHQYGNTAKIVETGETASATLEVHVQCFTLKGETAWGGNSPGGGDAWWYYYDTSVGGEQTIWAGQTINVGTVTVSDADAAGNRTITMVLAGDWDLDDVAEPVKIQGYTVVPDSRPAPGPFTTYKGAELVVSVSDFPFYAIHLDVGQWIPDPNFGP